jgi:hypothetical protein
MKLLSSTLRPTSKHRNDQLTDQLKGRNENPFNSIRSEMTISRTVKHFYMEMCEFKKKHA